MTPEVLRRARRYLARPELHRHRARLLARRAVYEAERRMRPARLRRDRLVRLGGDLEAGALRMWVRPVDVVDRSIYLYGVHEWAAVRAFAALVHPGATVVDAGAHVGQFTLVAAGRAGPTGRVLAFEPCPHTRARLVRNVEANGFGHVKVCSEALSDGAGTARLHVPADDTNTGLASLRATAEDGRSIEVVCARLDDVVAEARLGSLDVVKVDVEGAEAEVLAGASGVLREHRPAVLFEVNDLTADGERFHAPAIEVLRAHGYRIFGMRAVGSVVQLGELGPGEDPTPYREPWAALNLLALHPGAPAAGGVLASGRLGLDPLCP